MTLVDLQLTSSQGEGCMCSVLWVEGQSFVHLSIINKFACFEPQIFWFLFLKEQFQMISIILRKKSLNLYCGRWVMDFAHFCYALHRCEHLVMFWYGSKIFASGCPSSLFASILALFSKSQPLKDFPHAVHQALQKRKLFAPSSFPPLFFFPISSQDLRVLCPIPSRLLT